MEGKKKASIQRVSEGGDDNDSETKTELTRLHVIEEELPQYPGTPQQVSQKETVSRKITVRRWNIEGEKEE